MVSVAHPLKAPADGASAPLDPAAYDAVLVVSFGGPEGPDDVLPFLRNVTRGRGVPDERLEEVAHHYQRFGGVSPLNGQNRALIDALRLELREHAIELPIYFGNRNWHPLLPDTIQTMAEDGVAQALAFVTSGYSSYSGCRQYREDIFRAQESVGEGAPEIVKLRTFYNHPGFVEANAAALERELDGLADAERQATHVAFTAHSIPQAMAAGCRYESQLRETARLVADRAGMSDTAVVYQSRSGPPSVPWLEPDVCDHLRQVADRGVERVVIAPIGFLSDHMEVMFDLDVEAMDVGSELGLDVRRAATAGTDPSFVSMVRELIQERLDPSLERRTLGSRESTRDTCGPACCLAGNGRPSPWDTTGEPAEATR